MDASFLNELAEGLLNLPYFAPFIVYLIFASIESFIMYITYYICHQKTCCQVFLITFLEAVKREAILIGFTFSTAFIQFVSSEKSFLVFSKMTLLAGSFYIINSVKTLLQSTQFNFNKEEKEHGKKNNAISAFNT